jgi:ribosomal protein RSM22 (predicted rRNA methylase)
VILSHVLQEVSTSNLRRMIIDTLWNRVMPNGLFVIIEPGSPKGFRFIHDLRTWALEKDRSEASLVSPCPNHLKCPFAEKSNEWCHFSQQMHKFSNTVIDF